MISDSMIISDICKLTHLYYATATLFVWIKVSILALGNMYCSVQIALNIVVLPKFSWKSVQPIYFSNTAGKSLWTWGTRS